MITNVTVAPSGIGWGTKREFRKPAELQVENLNFQFLKFQLIFNWLVGTINIDTLILWLTDLQLIVSQISTDRLPPWSGRRTPAAFSSPSLWSDESRSPARWRTPRQPGQSSWPPRWWQTWSSSPCRPWRAWSPWWSHTRCTRPARTRSREPPCTPGATAHDGDVRGENQNSCRLYHTHTLHTNEENEIFEHFYDGNIDNVSNTVDNFYNIDNVDNWQRRQWWQLTMIRRYF